SLPNEGARLVEEAERLADRILLDGGCVKLPEEPRGGPGSGDRRRPLNVQTRGTTEKRLLPKEPGGLLPHGSRLLSATAEGIHRRPLGHEGFHLTKSRLFEGLLALPNAGEDPSCEA